MWNLMPNERLRHWSDFRKQISQLSLVEAIDQTQHLWCYAPFVKHYLDETRVSEWPDPWELVYENYYCDLAKALGMLYTLCLSDHKDTVSMELRIYKDANANQYNLVWINDGLYVANYQFNEVVNKTQIDNTLVLHTLITADQLAVKNI